MAPRKSKASSSSKRTTKQPAKRPRPTTSSNPLPINEQSSLDGSVHSAKGVIPSRFAQVHDLMGDPCLDIFNFQQWNDFLQTNEVVYPIWSATFIAICSVLSKILTSSVNALKLPSIDNSCLISLPFLMGALPII